MDTDINQRYRIFDMPVEGAIAEVGELIPYRNGNGFFRTVVIAVPGVLDTPAYLPLTLFGTDATDLDPQLDKDRPLKCTGRLNSRRYLDRNGRMRWTMSVAAAGVMLGPRAAMQPPKQGDADPRNIADDRTDEATDFSDVPF